MDDEILRERLERFMIWGCILCGVLMILITLFKAVQPYFLGLLENSQELATFFVVKIMTGMVFIVFGLYIWISKRIPQMKEVLKTLKQAADMKDRCKAELAAKDAEIESLRAKVAELEKAAQKGAQAAKKGNAGSETASTKRLTEWKEAYIPAMVKAALELGKDGVKVGGEKLQRKDVGALLDEFAMPGKALPSDCAEAVEAFRTSLPEGYLNKKGGAPKSSVTKIKQ